MRILYNGCVYNCTDNTTIKNMLSTGGVELAPPCIKEKELKIETETVKTRGRKKKQWGD